MIRNHNAAWLLAGTVLQWAINSVKKGGIVSIVGVYGPPFNLIPIGNVVADRINVIEDIIADLSKGHFPNMGAERGWKVEWKYNLKGRAAKIAVIEATGLLVYLACTRRKNSN